MNLGVLALTLTLVGGFTARASTIEYDGSIGAGTATRSGGFIGSVSGPGLSTDFSVMLSTSYSCCFNDLSAPGSYSIIDSAGKRGKRLVRRRRQLRFKRHPLRMHRHVPGDAQ